LTAKRPARGSGTSPDADPQDLLLLDDLVGIADREWRCPRSTRMRGGAG
jgi:hypothetical protein